MTGEVTKPADEDPPLKTWKSKNSVIIVWLVNSVEPANWQALHVPTHGQRCLGSSQGYIFQSEKFLTDFWFKIQTLAREIG